MSDSTHYVEETTYRRGMPLFIIMAAHPATQTEESSRIKLLRYSWILKQLLDLGSFVLKIMLPDSD